VVFLPFFFPFHPPLPSPHPRLLRLFFLFFFFFLLRFVERAREAQITRRVDRILPYPSFVAGQRLISVGLKCAQVLSARAVIGLFAIFQTHPRN
jgi:hypothetical protein